MLIKRKAGWWRVVGGLSVDRWIVQEAEVELAEWWIG